MIESASPSAQLKAVIYPTSHLRSPKEEKTLSIVEIIDDFPELTENDIRACLEFAADRNHRIVASVSAA